MTVEKKYSPLPIQHSQSIKGHVLINEMTSFSPRTKHRKETGHTTYFHYISPIEGAIDVQIEPGVDKDEIRLEEDEEHGEDDVDPEDRVGARRAGLELEEGDQLEDEVDRRPQAEDDRAEPQGQRAVALETV